MRFYFRQTPYRMALKLGLPGNDNLFHPKWRWPHTTFTLTEQLLQHRNQVSLTTEDIFMPKPRASMKQLPFLQRLDDDVERSWTRNFTDSLLRKENTTLSKIRPSL